MRDALEEELDEIKRLIDRDYTRQESVRRKSTVQASPRRSSAKAVAQRKKSRLLCILCIMVMLAFCVGFLWLKNADGRHVENDLLGTWQYDEYTAYIFEENGTGYLQLDGDDRFLFSYVAKDGTLDLSFELEYVNDCQYSYTVTDKHLTLIGGEGTAEIGKAYDLIKIQPE